MKNLTNTLLFLFCVLGCSQKKTPTINQNQNITAENLVEEITKEVKHYPKEIMYAFRQYSFNCYFEIYIDDILVAKNFDNLLADSFDINKVLFKSGIHHVNYKLYPLGNNNIYNTNYSTLVDDTDFSLSLVSYDSKNDGADDMEYYKYNLPKIETKVNPNYSTYKFEGSGKSFYEGKFDINVDVPFKISAPFENAQDLRKMNKKELEAKLLTKYKQVWSVYQNKEYDNIARLEYDDLKNLYVSNYDSKEIINENWQEYLKAYKSPSFQMQPVEKYKLEFFANGKMAALMLDTTDNRLRGNTALWTKVDYDGGLRPLFLNIYCYIPQGETELKVY